MKFSHSISWKGLKTSYDWMRTHFLSIGHMLASLYFPHYLKLGQYCLLPILAVCILACTLFKAWLFTFLQASYILQARWWEDVDFLQFTETFCQGGNHVKASKWSACTYMHQLVHQRVYIYFKFLHQLWARVYIYTPACTTTCTSILYLCINFERVYVSTSPCTSTCVSILRFCINFERV